MKKISGIIFDLDGVITDTSEFHFLAWKELADTLGVEINRAFNEKLKGISRMESLELILDHGNISEKFTVDEKLALATKKNDHYKQLIETVTQDDILPGIEDLLIEIKSENIKIGVASASRSASIVIGRLGITNYFDYIIDSNTVIHGKPDPEIFLKVADYLNIPAVNCIGIEDAYAGVKAINAAGMFSVGVEDTIPLDEADFVVKHTKSLSFQKIKEEFERIIQ